MTEIYLEVLHNYWHTVSNPHYWDIKKGDWVALADAKNKIDVLESPFIKYWEGRSKLKPGLDDTSPSFDFGDLNNYDTYKEWFLIKNDGKNIRIRWTE